MAHEECMSGAFGTVRHDRYTPADYAITRVTSFAGDLWCRQCLLEYLRMPEGEEVLTVTLHRPITNNYDRTRHNEVIRLHEQRKTDREKLIQSMR